MTPKEAMSHPYLRPVVELYKRLETSKDYSKSSPEYETYSILKSRTNIN